MKALVSLAALGLLYLWETWRPQRTGRRGRAGRLARHGTLALLNLALAAGVLTLARQFGFRPAQAGLLGLFEAPAAVETAVALVLFDFWMYLWHRLNHEWPLLWLLHRMHHTDREMDVTTAVRFHPGEVLLSSAARIGVLLLLGMSLPQLALYEILLFLVVAFHHSNVRITENVDRPLRALIATPRMHRVHHSDLKQETNSNYSSIFSFWDRLARSYVRRDDQESIRFGLKRFPERTWDSLTGMLKTPFAGSRSERLNREAS